MITLRPYEKNDAPIVLSWVKDDRSFFLWCADRFDSYPISSDEFNNIYSLSSMKGYIAEDNGSPIGHLFIQELGNKAYKFGLIIVDSEKRGCGYGKKMLECAISYAKKNLNASSITLSVFDINVSANECYKKLGFAENGKYRVIDVLGENHNYLEMDLFL